MDDDLFDDDETLFQFMDEDLDADADHAAESSASSSASAPPEPLPPLSTAAGSRDAAWIDLYSLAWLERTASARQRRALEQREYREAHNNVFPVTIVELCNFVFLTNLNQSLDWHRLIMHATELGIRTKALRCRASFVIACVEPRCSLSLFKSGRIVCSGVRSEAHAVRAIDVIIGRLRRVLGEREYASLAHSGVELCNYVGRNTLPVGIDTRRMRRTLTKTNEYPHIEHRSNVLHDGIAVFSGIRRVSVLMYASGNTVITGARNRAMIAMSMRRVAPLVAAHTVGSATTTFSMAQRQKYATEMTRLVRACERACTTQTADQEFVVVMSDGSVGDVRAWLEYMQPMRSVYATLLTLDGDAATSHADRVAEAARFYVDEGDDVGAATVTTLPPPPSHKRKRTGAAAAGSKALVPVASSAVDVASSSAYGTALVEAGQQALARLAAQDYAPAVHALQAQQRDARVTLDVVARKARAQLEAHAVVHEARGDIVAHDRAAKPRSTVDMPDHVTRDLYSG